MIYGYQGLRTLPIDTLIRSQYGGHFQYLTIQGLFLACATALISLIEDLVPSGNGLRSLKRILLITSMPVTIVISSIYWPLLFLATRLILPVEEGTTSPHASQFIRLPLSMDFALHAAPAISLLVDFLMLGKRLSRNELRFGTPAVSFFYTSFYAWWVERCASFNGKFPYPFLTESSLEIRMAIYFGAGSLALTSYWLINSLHA
ncbi:hypothetical protein GYMLUDRAFT_44239 [Collybiopsis luxurians FD-317 M1]|uniref:Unplaced genomic scaffold GYMLUscaffold_30, whole genome shotgun sequence n=1 Tax=Collybiopsis luxurians FD-317 M1 TaxID=944289 RepID=A0A0D0CBB2_9AGAR|nr:hypothetical protein GYMLUDRAFT_44239 [Collybiopsis luxurians FD-317 M1]